jgi:hypothetical protein
MTVEFPVDLGIQFGFENEPVHYFLTLAYMSQF